MDVKILYFTYFLTINQRFLLHKIIFEYYTANLIDVKTLAQQFC